MGYFRPAEGDIPTGADPTRVHTESFVMTATVSLSRSIAASAAGHPEPL